MCANCRGDDKKGSNFDAMSNGSVHSKSTAAISKMSKTSKRPPEGDQEESKSSRKRELDMIMKDYTNREYKRYHFLPHVNGQIPNSVKKQSHEERKQEDLKLYEVYKEDKQVIQSDDGGLGYYLISSEWIKLWRNFVTKNGPMPGMVENKPIADGIQEQRKETRYKVHDNDIQIKEPEDVYVLSEDFWSVFRDRYGCDLQIQMRKYRTLEDLVPKTMNYGK